MMEPKQYLTDRGFHELVKNIHCELTKKQPLENMCFDAWYCNNEAFFVSLRCTSKEFAQRLQSDLNISWEKEIPMEIKDVLERHRLSPKNWDDSPDGQLFATAVILSGWTANQLAAKARDNPRGDEKKILDLFKLLVNAAIEVGEEYTQES